MSLKFVFAKKIKTENRIDDNNLVKRDCHYD